MEPRASVGNDSVVRRLPGDAVDAVDAVAGGADDEPADGAADEDDNRWPGPIDEPPPLFS
jgi:hypothetical protein